MSFTSTVTDPDGDTPVTYAWSFGDTTTSTVANPSKTYTTPGKYTVSLTVTDARGAKTTKTLEINVTAAENICFSGRSDDFVGTALDTDALEQECPGQPVAHRRGRVPQHPAHQDRPLPDDQHHAERRPAGPACRCVRGHDQGHAAGQ